MADGPPPSSYFSMPFASDSHRSRTQGWPKNIFAFSGPWKIFGTTAEWCRPISFSRNAWNRVLSISAEEQEVKTDPMGLVLSQKLYPIRTDLLKKLLALRITTKCIKNKVWVIVFLRNCAKYVVKSTLISSAAIIIWRRQQSSSWVP